ncbi:MAG: hypothetical protein ABIY48_07610, partial [Acidimicrobiales bacterium]
ALLRALALAGLCLLAAVWAEWLLRTTRGDEASAIERRYRSYLVPVRTTGTAATPIHEVESIATLARLADHAGAPVLQSEDGVYQVIDGPRVFRYTADPVESRP